ncbi:MAG: sigma 54-interacting transcriptional regulator [Oscillospiraceae bacterium]
MNLSMVTDSASQIAWAIKRIMEVDVVVIDDELNRITDTFAYPRQRIEIRKNSIVGRIIETGKPLAIDDKERFQSCIECRDYEVCEMKSLIGVPITYEEKVVGAIALAISPKFMKGLFGNLGHTIGFLEKMAEMLSGKLQTEADYQKLNLTKLQREVLIDSMDEAIVLVDSDGLISYSNTKFNNYFFNGKTVINMPISAVIRHAQVEQYLKSKQSFEDKLIYCEYKNMSFDGYCSARTIDINGEYHGAVFTLKSITGAGKSLDVSMRGGYNLSKFLGSGPQMHSAINKAKNAAKNDDPILIEGKCGFRKLELAQSIHAESPRRDRNFLYVECANDSDEALESELFGSSDNLVTSKLRFANKGTLCICDIDKMPQFLQRRIGDYLVNRTITVQNREIGTDARLIFTASADLKERVDRGMFDELLYTQLSKQIIFLPQIGQDSNDIAAYLEYNFSAYGDRYGFDKLIVDPEVMDALCSYDWPGDVRQLKNAVEYLVINCKNKRITADLLEQLDFIKAQKEQTKSADQLVDEQILKLMASGKTRDEIANILRISRATLFRKLKKINSQGEQQND